MKMEQLKKFNIQDIKDGASLVWYDQDANRIGIVQYVAGPDKAAEVVVMDDSGYLQMEDRDYFRIEPVAKLEGKPVYPGDKFWLKYEGEVYPVSVKGFKNTTLQVEEDIPYLTYVKISKTPLESSIKDCTWTKPKQKREGWINIYSAYPGLGGPYETKEEADHAADVNRIDCVKISWEE